MQTMSLTKWVSLLLVLFGCSSYSPPVPEPELPVDPTAAVWNLVVDNGFGLDSYEDIVLVAKRWRAALGVRCPITWNIVRDRVDSNVPYGETVITIKTGYLQDPYLGWTAWGHPGDSYGARIVISPIDNRQLFRLVVGHEIGHGFKLDHTEDGIMNAAASDDTITEENILDFSKLWCK